MIYDKALTEKEKDLVILALSASMAFFKVPPCEAEKTLTQLYSFFMSLKVPENEPKDNSLLSGGLH